MMDKSFSFYITASWTCCMHIMTNMLIYLIGGICGAICFHVFPGH